MAYYPRRSSAYSHVRPRSITRSRNSAISARVLTTGGQATPLPPRPPHRRRINQIGVRVVGPTPIAAVIRINASPSSALDPVQPRDDENVGRCQWRRGVTCAAGRPPDGSGGTAWQHPAFRRPRQRMSIARLCSAIIGLLCKRAGAQITRTALGAKQHWTFDFRVGIK
jgi:hypothetical protein